MTSLLERVCCDKWTRSIAKRPDCLRWDCSCGLGFPKGAFPSERTIARQLSCRKALKSGNAEPEWCDRNRRRIDTIIASFPSLRCGYPKPDFVTGESKVRYGRFRKIARSGNANGANGLGMKTQQSECKEDSDLKGISRLLNCQRDMKRGTTAPRSPSRLGMPKTRSRYASSKPQTDTPTL